MANKASLETLALYMREYYPEAKYTKDWLKREIRKVIAEQLPQVCSVNGGYYMPLNEAEWMLSVDDKRNRAQKINDRADNTERYYACEIQGRLF